MMIKPFPLLRKKSDIGTKIKERHMKEYSVDDRKSLYCGKCFSIPGKCGINAFWKREWN